MGRAGGRILVVSTLLRAAAVLAVLAAMAGMSARSAFADADRRIVVRDGVLRWADDGSEVALFGVNYYPPFAEPYLRLKQMGADHRQVIARDVAHFARLGLTVIRLHVWDREISDAQGNLIENEHLALLDYLIAQCKKRGIYTVLTPIAWWGSPQKTHGFSDRFPMRKMTTDPEAIACQRRYLAQFVSHTNRYTGMTYKDDPAVVAIELINEPLYPPGTSDEQVISYINALTEAVRGAGCRKPIFFNCWGGRQKAVARSRADGASCGWYPTGLVAGQSRWDNFLPLVAHYRAFGHGPLDGKPKIIYEFDAADVPGSYMYPAMARSFREAGVQIATQFQYDCTPLASKNLCWQTHFLNLVYAPAKAISFAIAAQTFYRLPRGHRFGDYPESCRFGPISVSYDEDLSLLVDERSFMYSGPTQARPPAPDKLQRVWGCGSSPVVDYGGTGAYFLDRLRPGCWRLEVYPDAVWVADPYGRPSPEREVSRLIWRAHEMTVRLPELGLSFTARQIAPAQGKTIQAESGRFTVTPGVWVLVGEGAGEPSHVPAEFYCPRPEGGRPPAAWAMVPKLWVRGEPCPVEVWAAADDGPPQAVELWLFGERPVTRVALRQTRPYKFEGDVPAENVTADEVRWALALRDGHGWWVLPWDAYMTPEQAAQRRRTQIVLWRATDARDETLSLQAPDDIGAKASFVQQGEERLLRITARRFGDPPSCVALRLPARRPEQKVEPGQWALCIEARAVYPHTDRVEVSLLQDSGTAHGTIFPLTTSWRRWSVPLRDLRLMWRTSGPLDLSRLKEIAVVFGAWLYGGRAGRPHGIEIRRITLEPAGAKTIKLIGRRGLLPLVAPLGIASASPWGGGKRPALTITPGSGPGRDALRLTAGPFGPQPDCASVRFTLGGAFTPRQASRWRRLMARCGEVVITARAGQPHTRAVEIVFIERDGTPWGKIIDLSDKWKTVRLSIDDLDFFRHWHSAPEGRGGPGDRLHPENLSGVNICFGAWLFPEHRAEVHVVEIEQIALRLGDNP